MSIIRAASLLLALAAAAAPGRAQDYSGTWSVTGTDPQLGAYSGTALVTRSGAGYGVARLVELAQRLPDGRVLALSWAGQARNEGGGLRVEADLRRQEFVLRLNATTRGPQDKVPLRISALLAGAPAGPLAGGFSAAGVAGAETWTRSASQAPAIPLLVRRLDPAPVGMPRWMLRLFASYHALPELQPYVNRPEFQAGIHFQMVDDTARAWSRAHPDRLLVVQKVPDEIARLEEELRTRAFRTRLADKATFWDDAMISQHVQPSTGMLGGVRPGGVRHVSGDSALHQGVWVASQAFRFQVTGEARALQNVELGLKALLLMVDAPGNPSEFARAVGDAASADPGWTRSGAVPGVAYIPGGNNDMMHGISYGFTMAERVLPAGHPLLAEMGRRANQLVQNQKSAKRGKHKILLSGVAARHSGDPGAPGRYRRTLWNPLELLWLFLGEGEGLGFMQEIGGRSGQHLSTTTVVKVLQLGVGSPNLLERMWIAAAKRGVRVAWERNRVIRSANLGLVATLAGNAPGAADIGREVLGEIPCPSVVGVSADVDWRIDPDFCASPWPFLPWKFDFIQNVRGRFMSLTTYPLWTHADTDNWWKEGPYYSPVRGSFSDVTWSRQDWLHAYWVGRASGALSAQD